MTERSIAQRIDALIHALIAAADLARWLSWHGPEDERAGHAEAADALIEQLKRAGVKWAEAQG